MTPTADYGADPLTALSALGPLEVLSLELEQETGFDSIYTVARVYDRSDGDSILCPFPDCKYSRRDPAAVWWHVHFGPHGLSFNARTPDELIARRVSPNDGSGA